MFCGECGTENPDTNQFCKNCGKPLKKRGAASAAAPVATPQAAPAATIPAPAAPAVPVTSKLGWVLLFLGVICGIAAFFILPYILGLLAIILGAIAIYKKNKLGAISIVVGLAAVLVDYFWLQIF